MNETAKAWIHSLIAAAIGGASNSLLGVVVMPDTFNFTPQGWANMGKIALVGAVVPVLTLLKQSPLPASSITATQITSVTKEVTKD
jgi:hypothetical protein